MSGTSRGSTTREPLRRLPFPPLTKAHILKCSYHSWHPKLRSLTPKSRIIPLTDAFLNYLCADGIILPPEQRLPHNVGLDSDSGFGTDSESGGEDEDPSSSWSDLHARIQSTITELGGKVLPKLNWSAPKDASWISPTSDMECRTANEIYLLLKSSDFVTHDLEHAFDGCVEDEARQKATSDTPYVLVLRKSFNLNPSLEFRCFVRNRSLIAVSQREMNHFSFLFEMRTQLLGRIQAFLRDDVLATEYFSTTSGAEKGDLDNFVLDVYIPPPHQRVWLIDINPWAIRTDPLLFSWLELLTLPGLDSDLACSTDRERSINAEVVGAGKGDDDESGQGIVGEGRETPQTDIRREPELRLVGSHDPEAYQFSSTKYSAHKLPKEVVDASLDSGGNGGVGGMQEMLKMWKRVLDKDEEEPSD